MRIVFTNKVSRTMKTLAFTAATLAALAVPALAGGPTVIADDPMPAAAPTPVAAHDWSGPYVGLSYGKADAQNTYSTTGTFEFDEGSYSGIYAGYLMQRGNFVYGGELAFGKIRDVIDPAFPGSQYDRVLDLKGRLGFAADRALFYGVLGYSDAPFDDSGVEFDTKGLVAGLGVDFAVSQRLTMGLEYLARDLSADIPGISLDSSVDSLALRVGLSF
jgi:opacity protein-like surface antigen